MTVSSRGNKTRPRFVGCVLAEDRGRGIEMQETSWCNSCNPVIKICTLRFQQSLLSAVYNYCISGQTIIHNPIGPLNDTRRPWSHETCFGRPNRHVRLIADPNSPTDKDHLINFVSDCLDDLVTKNSTIIPDITRRVQSIYLWP